MFPTALSYQTETAVNFALQFTPKSDTENEMKSKEAHQPAIPNAAAFTVSESIVILHKCEPSGISWEQFMLTWEQFLLTPNEQKRSSLEAFITQ